MAVALHIDFETYSEAKLDAVGADVYARHPSTEALLLAWKLGEGPVQLVDFTLVNSLPNPLVRALKDPGCLIHAFNANFERLILEHVLGMKIPARRFRCTMVKAYGLAFQGTLADVQKQVGMAPDVRKMEAGRRLIHRFCKPQPKTHKTRRWTRENDPEQWEIFKEYCRQDVVAEYELDLWLEQYKPMSDQEWELWALDQEINDRGVPVDKVLCQSALKIHQQLKRSIKANLKELTALENPLSNVQMRQWLHIQNQLLPNLQQDTLARAIPAMPDEVALVMTQYQAAVKTAPTKWKAFLTRLCDDGTVKGAHQFAGASRTRRWAGRGVQLQNLKRGPSSEAVPETLRFGNTALVEALYEDPMEELASSVRSAITAPQGRSLVVCDLSSIESVVLGYLSGCRAISYLFHHGLDTYKVFASHYFCKPYAEVTKSERNFSKPPVLGCGYQLGGQGLVKYAEGYGVEMPLEIAQEAVDLFRTMYPEVPRMWYGLLDMIRETLTPGATNYRRQGYGVTIYKDNRFLYIELPSGRRLCYYQPIWQEWETPIGTKPSFTYMGIDRFTFQWQRLAAHGGLITENIVQAVARDILAGGMMRYARNGGEIIGHVHDEIIAIADEDQAEGELELLKQCMTDLPDWLPGMWLGADGWIGKRYRKD